MNLIDTELSHSSNMDRKEDALTTMVFSDSDLSDSELVLYLTKTLVKMSCIATM